MTEQERAEIDREVERQISRHGGLHASLIRASLEWLREEEPKWNLDRPMNKDKYIDSVVSRAVIPVEHHA